MNEHEYKITCHWAKRFQQAVDNFDDGPREGVHPLLVQAERYGLECWLARLREEIEEYKRLKADPTAKPKKKEPNPFDGAEAHCEIGKHYRSKGDLDGAIAHFDEAIRIRPDYEEAIQNRAATLALKADSKPTPSASAT